MSTSLPPPPTSTSIPLDQLPSSDITMTSSSSGAAPAPNPSTPIDTAVTPTLSSPETPLPPETPVASQTPATARRRGSVTIMDPGSTPRATGPGGLSGLRGLDGLGGLGYGVVDAAKGKGKLGRDEEIVLEGEMRRGSAASSTMTAEIGGRQGESLEAGPAGLAGSESGQVVSMPTPTLNTGQEAQERENEDTEDGLDVEALRRMRTRLEEMDLQREGDIDGWAQRDELAEMVRTLLSPMLEQVPFLHEQVQAQRDTILTMQEQARLSEQLLRLERERHSAERHSWHTETTALMKQREAEIAAGTRPKRVLDLDVGYHQELEAANKRLEMDNRLMAPRLADTQRQIDRLVTELRHLRAHVVLSTEPLVDGQQPHPPQLHHMLSAPISERKSRSPSKASLNGATMGDARTEHLLLAAKKVRAMRARGDETVGRLTLEELKRGGVVGPDGGIGYSEGYGGVLEEEDDEVYDSELEDEKPVVDDRRGSVSKGKNRVMGTPLLPKTKRGSKSKMPPTTPSRARAEPPQTTPGGSNFNDLLRAAELATRPVSPSPGAGTGAERAQLQPMSTMSATRSTTRPREENPSQPNSPTKRPRREGPVTAWGRGRKIAGMEVDEGELENEDEDEEGREVHQHQRQAGFPSAAAPVGGAAAEGSALDLLAQASQLDMAQSASTQESNASAPLQSAARLGGVMEQGPEVHGGSSPRSSAAESALGPAIDLHGHGQGQGHGQAQVHGRIAGVVTIEDHQIDPTLIGGASPDRPTVAITPKSRPRQQSISEVVTPARGYSSYPETPYEGTTPGAGGFARSPPSVARSESLAHEPPLGAFASPTGATVPGLGKYVHLTSSMPARRIRSPYLKWTVEEDELLARAVAIHGEKWDLVSKGVPTRSYHQVRQRWLRKTGAFDKKPPGQGDGSSLRDEFGREETSPTPMSKGQAGKKRKAA